MKKVMQWNQSTGIPLSQGSVVLDGGQALFRLLSLLAPQRYAPEHVDDVHGWYRLVAIAEAQVSIQVLPSGSVSWRSPVPLTETDVLTTLQRLFLPMALSESALEQVPADLAERFRSAAPLTHIASASLGEAVIKAVIRQVIAASHARKLIRTFVLNAGPTMQADGMAWYGFPSLETIARLVPDDLRSWGLGYKANLLPRIAQDLLAQQAEERIGQLPSEEAVAFLQQVKGIGRWTARVAICDVRGDWLVYPFEDLAVRTWAKKLWPQEAWPQDERAFLAAWQKINGSHTGLITCYLLAQAGLLPQSEPPRQLALV